MALSDDFARNKFGVQWRFYSPGPNEQGRARYENGALVVAGKGEQPHDSSPLTFIVGDQRYRVTAELEIEASTRAGLLLFYNKRLYCGLGFDKEGFVMHRYGLERRTRFRDRHGETVPHKLWLRVTNDRHIVTLHHSRDGREWTKFDVQMEVSGYHHNVAYDFLSLRPAIYAAGRGVVKVYDVKYEALPT
jgi:beta-xylosidase